MNNMWGESPSGREQAIETLLDMDPNGSFYRASRILEEAVPQDLLQRPNLITKSALVDQAYALSKFEIDTVEKYDQLFGTGTSNKGSSFQGFSFPTRLRRADSDVRKNRILKHHSKILEAKKGRYKQQNASLLAPSPQLVAALRQVYGNPNLESKQTAKAAGESTTLRSLLKSVMEHPAFSTRGDATGASIEATVEAASDRASVMADTTSGSGSASFALESLIAYLCENLKSNGSSPSIALEHGLLIAVLSVLMGCKAPDDGKGTDESRTMSKERKEDRVEAVTMPPLQVGALMSLLPVEDNDAVSENPWALDTELINYLGDAAAVYEERIEIQKARLLKRITVKKADEDSKATLGSDDGDAARVQGDIVAESSAESDAAAGRVPSEESTSTPKTPAQTIASPHPVETPATPGTPSAAGQQEEEVSATGLNVAALEQMISAAATEEQSGDQEDANQSESSEQLMVESDDEAYNYGGFSVGPDEEGSIVDDEDEESSSSSSSASGDEPEDGDDNELEEAEDDEEQENIEVENDEEDDDVALRQALALSLVEQVDATRSDTSLVIGEIKTASLQGGSNSDPVTPGAQTPLSEEEPEIVEEKHEESPLPPFPPTPKVNPYALEHLTKSGEEGEEVLSDVSLSLDPSALHLFGSLPTPNVLMHLLKFLGDLMDRRILERSNDGSASRLNDGVRTSSIPGGTGSCLFPPIHPYVNTKSLAESDSDFAISLQLLVALFLLAVKRRSDGINSLSRVIELEGKAKQDEDGKGPAGGSPGEEGDDPAIAMALTYLDDEVSETKDSLEAKGMTRKAAAAAHDAAVLLESLRRRSDAWKEEVKMYSHCAIFAMRYLRHFLHGIVRRWLQERQGFSAIDCQAILPDSVKAQLSSALFSFSSSIDSFSELVDNEKDESTIAKVESVFLPAKLSQESMLLWGETIPLIYPTVSDQVACLRQLLDECSTGNGPPSISRVESDVHVNKLQILCRRLRVCDLLDRFVPSPACFLPGETESDFGEGLQMLASAGDVTASSVIALIGSKISSMGGLKGEIQNLYLSLCHRCHARILLWDGLFACNESETDDLSLALATPPADSVRLDLSVSNRLQFDATKCSDSMAIFKNAENSGSVSNSSCVHQRASKVWGTVLSTMSFAPKSGIHRWAVRLDKCERGHVFIGVATSQASTRTYVGGDKFGWGMIGTQALWHDRRKIRGDYGETFRTGASIIVTLDTDAGTLSYSSWKDSSSSGAFSIDQVAHTLASPRRQGHAGGGSLEDWGVAFEGLPLDSKLYPAVGLYQRDDRVTVLAVDSSKEGNSGLVDLSAGFSFYPALSNPSNSVDKISVDRMEHVRRFNESLQLDGMRYAEEVLRRIKETISNEGDGFFTKSLLPSLAASICLFPPSIPVLSERFSLFMLPKLRDVLTTMNQNHLNSSLFSEEIFPNLSEGKWVIRATGSSGLSSNAEEYVVELSRLTAKSNSTGFQATGVGTTGKSKNGLVAIFGCVNGSLIHFVEEWANSNDEGFTSLSSEDTASSCVVTARLSLDGTKFEGTYRNVQFGTSGQIAGLFQDGNKERGVQLLRLDSPVPSTETPFLPETKTTTNAALIGLAHGHLASIIGEDPPSFAPVDWSQQQFSANEGVSQSKKRLRECLSLETLSQASVQSTIENISRLSEKLAMRFLQTQTSGRSDLCFRTDLFDDVISSLQPVSEGTQTAFLRESLIRQVDEADESVVATGGRKGSLSALCPVEYGDARRLLICAILFHSSKTGDRTFENDFSTVCVLAVKIMEDAVRKAITKPGNIPVKEKAVNCCRLFCEISKFLLRLDVPPLFRTEVDLVGSDLAEIYERVTCPEDINFLEEEMTIASQKAFLRLVSLRERLALLEQPLPSVTSVESIVVGLPKLLGRKSIERRRPDHTEALGGHLPTGLSGAAVMLRLSMKASAQRVVEALVDLTMRELSQRKDEIGNDTRVLVDSTTLTLVSSLTALLQSEGLLLDSFVGRLINLIPLILNEHRDSVFATEVESQSDDGKEIVIQRLSRFGRIETSRGVLRATSALAHVLSYQVWNTPDIGMMEAPSLCLDFLLRELRTTAELLLVSHKESHESLCEKQSEVLWQRFLVQIAGPDKARTATTRPPRRQVGSSGIKFLWDQGGHLTQQANSPQKSLLSNRKARQSSREEVFAEETVFLLGSFGHHYFSHWLHVLAAATKSKGSATLLAKDPELMSFFSSALGMSRNFERTESINLPARYCCRILRLVFPVLTLTDPSVNLVTGLFELAGSSFAMSTASTDPDEGMVSREAVSLLRRLHSPSRMLWRDCINEVVQNCLESNEGATNKTIGALCFFNGSFEALRRGSHVLLKPAAAVPVSAEQQALLSSSKSHSSGNSGATGAYSLPHHIIGNGTEGMVAGLCRSQAPAGIVSSIDLKNAVCEVILLSRNQTSVDAFPIYSHESRKPFTVRALRSPLVDVVQAQAYPIFVDCSIARKDLLFKVLRQSLVVLSTASSGSNEKEFEAGGSFSALKYRMDEITTALMALKAAITLLSDEQLALLLLDEKERDSTPLHGLLDLAVSPGAAFSPGMKDTDHFMSSFPIHETRLVHILSLFRRLGFEESILVGTSEDVVSSRIADLVRSVSESESVLPVEQESSTSENTSTGPGFSSGVPAVRSENKNIASVAAPTNRNRMISQSTASSDNSDDENDESEAAATAAAHLREAAIAQMAELGLPRSWSELALRRVGGTNIEAAVHFCLERGGEMERLLAEERERERESSGADASRRRENRSETSHLLRQLMEMGFPSRWCAEALAATGNNVDEALTWILTNGERLSAEDEGMEDLVDDGDDDEEDEDGDEEDDNVRDDDSDATEDPSPEKMGEKVSSDLKSTRENLAQEEVTDASWKGSVVPLRFISGRSIIDSSTLSISGLPSGGFSSVGTKGVLLTSGKWYYEAILETAGCLQIGWADGSFAGHCHAERGDGCGDGPSSWSFDGWRRYRWHSVATEWGCRWAEGDVVGCMVDMDDKVVSFTLNGKAEEIGMGVAFSGHGFRPCSGVYACVSFNRKERLKLILGGAGSAPFKFQPPPGYRGVGDAVLHAVNERNLLVAKESVLDNDTQHEHLNEKPFLCDFSDGEHGHELMAWAHRYYGSDASVHLGSGRYKQSAIGIKTSSTTTESTIAHCLMRRFDKQWSKGRIDFEAARKASDDGTKGTAAGVDGGKIMANMHEGLVETGATLYKEFVAESSILAALTARKLLLHLIVATGPSFNPSFLFGSTDTERKNAIRFWRMIEFSASLRSAGWVGEAGAMAVAAEALGLGISSNETTTSRLSSGAVDRSGLVSLSDLDDGVILPTGGIVQLLSSVFDWRVHNSQAVSTGGSLVACSEAAIGSDGGGAVLSFLLKGLQSAICKSEMFRRVVVASVRCSIRRLSAVEYDGDDTTAVDAVDDEDDIEKTITSREKRNKDDMQLSLQPDARLVSFVSGLLLSSPVASAVPKFEEIQKDLFEAWSVGLLSASLPWRMICAFVAAGVLNQCPSALSRVVSSFPTLAGYYARLRSTVARRVWAERAAMPVCSRFSQAMVELLCSVSRAVKIAELPPTFLASWEKTGVDAATPRPFNISNHGSDWETTDCWVSSDREWETWTGTVEREAVDWKPPTRSAVRALVEGGDGPPMLREGCTVMRGLDWDDVKYQNADGKDGYDEEKARRQEELKKAPAKTPDPAEPVIEETNPADASSEEIEKEEETGTVQELKPSDKKKMPSPKLPIGVVLSIEPWNGVPGMGRRVKWKLTGKEGLYRYGGDGGNFDLSHVEVNNKGTRVRKRHPLPESAEQCAARHGFGRAKLDSILLRLKRRQTRHLNSGVHDTLSREGILEWPEFNAGILVECLVQHDGAVVIKEKDLLFGSKDAGWEARFGQPSYVPGTEIHLQLESSDLQDQPHCDTQYPSKSLFEELVGTTSFPVKFLRRKEDGKEVSVLSEFRIQKPRVRPEDAVIQSPMPPSFSFDPDFHASSLALSRDGKTLSCVSSDGRGTAFANLGFSKGVHYWEIKLEQADIGSVFIGVAEKPNGSGSSSDSPPRLNRWHGWGFVNFRATYTSGAERIYGAHCHAGDTIGVLLDCDAGRISFFFDGLKYGEHIINDLGCAFENLSPFGFNCDGCGSGGVGEGAPSGVEGSRSGRYLAQGSVRPRTLWPVVGLRNQGDRVTISAKWNSSYGTDGLSTIRNLEAVAELCHSFSSKIHGNVPKENVLPRWFAAEAFDEYLRWSSDSWKRSVTRGSGPYKLASFGMDIDFDTSPIACAAASALLGLKNALLPGDRVRLKRSAGRVLELAEEAVVLGAYQGRLYYQIVAQKSEGGSLTEGGGRAWCWDESEVVDGLDVINDPPKGLNIELPLMNRFRCPSSGGLKIVYENGAVVRSDLEIFDGSLNLGTVPVDTVIPERDVLERRVNSCGVVRFRVRYESLEGWISSRIRGGKEESIVFPVHDAQDEDRAEREHRSYATAGACADTWLKNYFENSSPEEKIPISETMATLESFCDYAEHATIEGLTTIESDTFLARTICNICAFSFGADPLDTPFKEIASALAFGIAAYNGKKFLGTPTSCLQANQAAATAFESLRGKKVPSLEALLARASILRAFNRRARVGLPWFAIRPCQESSAILGGVYGHGASVDRAGRHSNSTLLSNWVEVPSLATAIRDIRGLIFTTVKKELLWSVTAATTTPTPLSHDEYELPREIRTVRINRLRARRVMSGEDMLGKRKYSVFSQLMNETKAWGGAAFRRGFVAKGHGGQKRAFKVKLIGEGVNDYSGPYREVFTDAIAEVRMFDRRGNGSLGVLDPTPNNVAGVGDDRDLFMFSLNDSDIRNVRTAEKPISEEEKDLQSSFSTLIAARDESSRETEENLVFLGKLAGTAFRHGIPLDLPLPLKSVWQAIVEEKVHGDGLEELDMLAHRQRMEGSDENVKLLQWQRRMLNSFVSGISSILPVELFPILKGDELRDLFCGNAEIDVDMLRSIVEYEGYEDTDDVIQHFWETLREFTLEERKLFLQFVWARNRLPLKEVDFDAPFKIQKDSTSDSNQSLPSASTCFFSLSLPAYTSKEQLREKLLFAINNVTTMETDFQTNSAEISEGYRAF